MFTLEARINGTMIFHIYGRNVSDIASFDHENEYEFDYYGVEARGVTKGKIVHNRKDGLETLLKKILEQVEKK